MTAWLWRVRKGDREGAADELVLIVGRFDAETALRMGAPGTASMSAPHWYYWEHVRS